MLRVEVAHRVSRQHRVEDAARLPDISLRGVLKIQYGLRGKPSCTSERQMLTLEKDKCALTRYHTPSVPKSFPG